MAGNFSFGDYFKAGAIEHAWNAGHRQPGRRRLRLRPRPASGSPSTATTTRPRDLWQRIAGLPAERIQRRGGKDNYWDMGVPGPGGPCSEIYYDRGPEHGREGGPVVDEDRYLEIWNLVFMQDVRGELRAEGRAPADRRAAAARTSTPAWASSASPPCCRASDNVYETDLVRPVIERAEELSGRRYGATATDDVRFRVIADHARSGVHDHRRRGDARQRGPRLRAAPAAAPDRALGPAARRDTSRCCGAFAEVVRDAMAPVLPGAGHRLRADLGGRAGRGGGVPRHARPPARGSSTRAVADDQAGRAARCCPATRPSSCTTPTASRST